jgi:hypothetical protein
LCECEPDEGVPCEEHSEVLVQREGASLRTGHQLARLEMDDLAGIGIEPTGEERELMNLVDQALEAGGWLDDQDLVDAMNEAVKAMEGRLPEDQLVVHCDGYQVFKLLPGCPLLEA